MTKEITIVELADMVGGRISGAPSEGTKITGTCAIDNYIKGKVSFVRSRKYAEFLGKLQDAVVLIPGSLADLCDIYPQNIYVVVEDVINPLMDTQDFFYEDQFATAQEGISPTAKIDKTAIIGSGVYIGENVCVARNTVIGDGTQILHNSLIFENVIIGSDTYIYPGVCIYRNCRIGNECIIHSGVRMGVDGFRFEQDIEHRKVRKILHVGRVVIGDRVEIGANSVVDRATFENDATIVSDDVKIDNLVHVAHNAEIGPRTLIVAQTCVGGSTRIGEDVWIGIGAAISDNVSIGNRAKVLLNAVVAYDVKDDEMVSGFYAMPHKRWKQVYKKLKEEI